MKRVAILLLILTAACTREPVRQDPVANAGAQRGKQLLTQYGCTACHAIPGVEGAVGSLGPSLQGLASRPTISSGTVQNTSANLAQFIQNPASLNPQSSMPPLALAGNDAEDITAFLMTLR